MQFKRWVSERLPAQFRHWLWARKVTFGNRRIRELGDHISQQIHQAAQQDVSLLESMNTKAEWELFRNEVLHALRRWLTNNVTPSEIPDSVITGTLEQDRCRIDNVIFLGHMDMSVTANIYRPLQTTKKNARDYHLSQSSRSQD